MAVTFRGGIYVEEHKNTRKYQIERMPAPAKVRILLSQHIGAPCKPVVVVGNNVGQGQKIGDIENGFGCPVHASVSGRIVDITEKHIEIENDYENRIFPDIKPFEKRLPDTSFDEIVKIIREAGIAGLGGATFPTYAKLESAAGKVKHLFINCAECEPLVTVNHRLLLENPAAVINGTKILMKALGIRQSEIAVTDNKIDAVNKLETLTADSDLIKVRVLRTKYPQGDETQVVYALTGREVPAGKLPIDVECVVFNAETCAVVFNAFSKGMPLIERMVTVDGDCIKTPKNVMVPLGVSYQDLIDFCGGFKREPKKIINGGPMMGTAQLDLNAPVTKGTLAILAFSAKVAKEYGQPPACIRCGRCVESCPKRLMPLYLGMFAYAGKIDMCEKYDIMSCCECGACSYVCPGNLQLVHYIKEAKFKIREVKAENE
ncbi:MAG: electron transport complex subunit RsxC [Oscillospiraceae bacterium]|nr:electron transport complex subunit RsxC [Oscillospiraceae bacterium]